MDPRQPQSFTPQFDNNQSFVQPLSSRPQHFGTPAPQPFETPQHEAYHYEHHGQQPHHEEFATVHNAALGAPAPLGVSAFDQATQSKPVVKVLSPFGIEYVFLALSLFLSAGGLLTALLILVNGSASFGALAFPAAMLLVTVPVFAALFLRLKKLELRMPHLRLDASKRRTTQFIQIVSFITTLVGLITFVYAVFAKMAGQSSTPIGKATLDMLCVVVVAGGVLAYYWREEHTNRPS